MTFKNSYLDNITKPNYDDLFRIALLIRRVEDRIIEIYPEDKVQSPVHLSIGQEAIAVGACAALKSDDWVFSSYRSHAYFIAKGGRLDAMFAELFGKFNGGSKGKAGSMHLTAPEVGLLGSSAVVATTIPHAVGAAYASKLNGDGRVHLIAYGDGATEEGVYHECLNFAALHKLPVLFLCENNGLAIHSPITARQSYSICKHARSFGIAAQHIKEGYDILSVFNGVAPLVEAARRGEGPQLIEIETCRYKEHVGPNDDFHAGYRSEKHLREWQLKDPLIHDSARITQFQAAIEKEIDAAVEYAEQSPWPGPEELLSDVGGAESANLAKIDTKYFIDLMENPTITYGQALFRVMDNALEKNKKAIIFGQGVDDHRGTFATTLNLHKKFGKDRVFDMPLMEEAMAGIALGCSLNGTYPINTHIRADFILLAANQIINLIAKYRYMFGGQYRLPMLIRAMIGRSWGQGAQHSQSLQSLFSHIPGLTVIMPASSQDILETYPYITEHFDGPVISFEHRLLYDLAFSVDWQKIGKPRMPLTSRRVREGKDVTIVAASIMVLEAQRAASYLHEITGIECEVINLHCVSNPDQKLILDSVRKTGRLIVADTSWASFGVAAEICRLVCELEPNILNAPVVTLGMARAPCPTAKTLEDIFYPNQHDFVDAIARLVTGKMNHKIPLPKESSMTDVYKTFKGPF